MDIDTTNVRVNKVDGLVVSFLGTSQTPAIPDVTDNLGRTITLVRDVTNQLDSPQDGIFVFKFTTGAIELSDRSRQVFSVQATSANQFVGSDAVELNVVRDTSGTTTVIKASSGTVRPSVYEPIASGVDADQGKVTREDLDQVLQAFQFVMVANALVSDSRLMEGLANPRRVGLIRSGSSVNVQKLFPILERNVPPGALQDLRDGTIRTKRLMVIPDGVSEASDVQLSTGAGEVTAAYAPLSNLSLIAPPPPSKAFVFAMDLRTDANNDGRINAADESIEEGLAIREGIVSRTIVINGDDDDNSGGTDNANAVIDGASDERDMAKLVLSKIPTEITDGTITLNVSDKSVVRVFDDNDQAVLGPTPGPDRDESLDLLQSLQGPDDLEFRVEGVKAGHAVLSIIYRDAAGAEVSRDEVLITIAEPIQRNLTGAPLSEYPYIDFGNTFNQGSSVFAAVDGFRRPDKVGKTANVYIVDHKKPDEWEADPVLNDVSGTVETLTIVAMSATDTSSVQKNRFDIWTNANTPGRYDVVFDFGTNADEPNTPDGEFDPSVDFIDTIDGSPAGLFVVEDTTAGGPFGVGILPLDEPNTIFVPAGFDGGVGASFAGLDGTPGIDRTAQIKYPALGAGVGAAPATGGPFPLVVIAHGRHAPFGFVPASITSDENYRGYDYLQDHLASHGYVSVSVDLDDVVLWPSTTTLQTAGILARAWILLDVIERMESMNAGAGSTLGGKIDLDNVILVGHSRGGEAVVQAWRLNNVVPLGPSVGPGAGEGAFPIRAVVSIAPTTVERATAPPLDTIPYLVIYGSADGDVNGINAGVQPFRFYDLAKGPKQLVWIYGANHNYFNVSWPEDDGAGTVAIAERRTAAEQRVLVNGYVLAFLKAYFRDSAVDVASGPSDAHLEYFLGPTNLLRPAGLGAFPLHIMYGKTAASRIVVDDFEHNSDLAVTSRNTPGVDTSSLVAKDELDLDGGPDVNSSAHTFFHQTKGVLFGWSNADAGYVTVLSPADRNISGFEALSFRVTLRALDSLLTTGDLRMAVGLRDAGGQMSVIRTEAFTKIPEPHLRTDTLNPLTFQPGPPHNLLTKSALKTIRIPVSCFILDGRNLDITNIEQIFFQFEVGGAVLTGTGRVALDDIEFTLSGR